MFNYNVMNPSVEQMLYENPLTKFSIYTDIQVRIINQLGTKICTTISDWKDVTSGIDAATFDEAYGNFWLWVLGAFEIARTMDQSRTSFVDSLHEPMAKIKRRLAQLRTPFAKQKLTSRKEIYTELSVVNFDGTGLKFKVDGETIDAVPLIKDVATFFKGISSDMILEEMPVASTERVVE